MRQIELGPNDSAIIFREKHAECYSPRDIEGEESGMHAYFAHAVMWAMSNNPEIFEPMLQAFDASIEKAKEEGQAN